MRLIGLVLAVSFALVPFATVAQQAGKVYRVGVIGLSPISASVSFIRALEAGLSDAGYSPGRNIIVEFHSAQGQPTRLADVAKELARSQVDVIVASTNEVIQATKQATTTIPIVMALAADPVGAGFVASLARPGGNITGLAIDAEPEVYAKPLEFLKQTLPGFSRAAILRNPDPTVDHIARTAMNAARRIDVSLSIIEVRDAAEFIAAIGTVKRDRIPAVLVWPNGVVYGARRQLIEAATKDRIVVTSTTRQFVEDGALLSYGPSVLDLYKQTANYVDKILKGTKPSELPVEQPTKFELVVNLKTAKALGLTIPQTLLLRADEVIQ